MPTQETLRRRADVTAAGCSSGTADDQADITALRIPFTAAADPRTTTRAT